MFGLKIKEDKCWKIEKFSVYFSLLEFCLDMIFVIVLLIFGIDIVEM